MNSPLKLTPIVEEHPSRQTHCTERIEDYLDNLCAPLIGIVPYKQRVEFRAEAYAHLEALNQEYLYQGKEQKAATEAACKEFGEPWKVGQAFLHEWSQGTPLTPPARLIRKATCTAFAWFGTATMLILLLLERCTLLPGQNAWLPCVRLMAVLAPFVAGGLTGATTSAHAGRGARNALLILILHSFTTGLLLLPRYEGLVFACGQLLFWLPMGYLTATLTALCVRHLRRQRFWQTAR